MDKMFSKLVIELSKLEVIEILGVCKILEVSIVDENKKPRNFEDIYIDIFDRFIESNRATRRGIIKLLKMSNLEKEAKKIDVNKDLSNLQEVAQQIEEIRKSPELQEKYRKTSFEVIANHVDINAVNQQLLKDLGAY